MQNLIQVKNVSFIKVIITLSLLIGGAYMLWLYWPMMMIQSIKWQHIVNDELSNLLYEAKQNPLTATAPLLGLSFLYGALHSIGPGHGKVIVSTFLATHPSKVKHSLVLTILSSLMQALVAIILVSALVFIFDNSMRQVNATADDFIKISFLIVAGLGALLSFRSLRKLYQPSQHKQNIHHEHEHHHEHSHEHSHEHNHSEGQCCGHQHVATAEQINNATTWQAYAAIIMSIGMRPCTGAIMVLLFSNMIGIYWLGIVSTILMSVGTAISTSTIALLTLSGKKIISQYLGHDQHKLSKGNSLLQLIGGILLMLIGLLLFSTSSAGMAPMFS
jgi:nickel/cobalt exporter